MTPARTARPAAYDDPTGPAEMCPDCRAADASLELAGVARRIRRPAPSIRFEDYTQGMSRKDIEMLAAANALARALHL